MINACGIGFSFVNIEKQKLTYKKQVIMENIDMDIRIEIDTMIISKKKF